MFSGEPTVSVIVMSVELSRKVQKLVEDKASRHECLECEEEEYCRGLCKTHYSRYRTARNSLPKSKQHTFEAKLIENGKLAEDMQGRRRDIDNHFRALAESMS